jgi:hypothetical protein
MPRPGGWSPTWWRETDARLATGRLLPSAAMTDDSGRASQRPDRRRHRALPGAGPALARGRWLRRRGRGGRRRGGAGGRRAPSAESRAARPPASGHERDRGAERLSRRPDRPEVVLTSTHDPADFGERLYRCGARGFVPTAELSGDALAALLASGWRRRARGISVPMATLPRTEHAVARTLAETADPRDALARALRVIGESLGCWARSGSRRRSGPTCCVAFAWRPGAPPAGARRSSSARPGGRRWGRGGIAGACVAQR